MTKIAKSLAMIALVAALAVGATGAYFTDSETISGNTFTAGTLDLQINAPTSAVWTMSNMSPGDSTTGTLSMTNVGTLKGNLTASIVFNDADLDSANHLPLPDMTALDVAKQLEATVVSWTDNDGTMDLWPHITNVNGNGWKDLDDVRQALTTTGILGTLVPGETGALTMTLQFRFDAGNDFQGDGVEAVITVNLQNV